MSTRIQKILSFAIGMDNSDAMRALRAMYGELGKARAATRPLTDSLNLLKGVVSEYNVTSAQNEIIQNRLILQSAKRAEQVRKEAQAVRELAEAETKAAAARNADHLGISGYKGSSGSGGGYVPGMGYIKDLSQFQAMMKGGSSSGPSGYAAGASAAAAAYKEAASGARAWASGLKEVKDRADAAIAAAKAAEIQVGLDRRAARRGSRTAFSDALNGELDKQDTTRSGRRAQTDAGNGYMSQFNNSRQNAMAQFREANAMRRSGLIAPEQYQRAVAAIRSQNSLLNQSFASLKSTVGALVGPLVLAYSAYRGFVGSIKLSAELDEAKAKFRVFTGSAAEAARILKDVRKLSSESPVSFQGGQRSLTTMLQYGVEAKNITRTLRTLAEITGGNTERMESLSLAYAQANAAGRLMGQELLQMVNAGFNPLKVISEQTGKSMADLKAEMQDGQISFAMVEQAFKDATGEGGKFNGLLEEISNTTAGKINLAQSSLEQFGIAFGDMLKPATDGALDAFIDDMTRLAEVMQMVASAGVDLQDGISVVADLANPLASFGKEVFKSPSYAKDILAKQQANPSGDPYSKEQISRAEAIKRLKRTSVVSEEEVKWAEDYLKVIQKIKAAIEDGKTGKLSAKEQAGAKTIQADADKAKRDAKNTSDEKFKEGSAKYKAEVAEMKKAGNPATQADLDKKFSDLIEEHGQGRFGDKAVEDYKKVIAEQEKSLALDKEKARVQAAFKDLQDSTAKENTKARYGDKAGIVGTLQEQATGDGRRILNAMIAAGAAYNDIVLAANEEAQAQADSLDSVMAKTKAIEDAAAAEKKAADDQTKFDKRQNDESKARKNKYLADTEKLREEAKKLKADEDPNSGLIESLANIELMRKRGKFQGGLSDEDANNARDRIASEASKKVSVSAAPVIGRGSQEAYRFITGQTVDNMTKQLQETEKQTLLQSTAVEVAKKTNEKLDELIAGIPEVVGP